MYSSLVKSLPSLELRKERTMNDMFFASCVVFIGLIIYNFTMFSLFKKYIKWRKKNERTKNKINWVAIAGLLYLSMFPTIGMFNLSIRLINSEKELYLVKKKYERLNHDWLMQVEELCKGEECSVVCSRVDSSRKGEE